MGPLNHFHINIHTVQYFFTQRIFWSQYLMLLHVGIKEVQVTWNCSINRAATLMLVTHTGSWLKHLQHRERANKTIKDTSWEELKGFQKRRRGKEMWRVTRMKMTSKRTQREIGRVYFNRMRHPFRAFLCEVGVSLMSQASRVSCLLIGYSIRHRYATLLLDDMSHWLTAIEKYGNISMALHWLTAIS